MDTNNGNMIVRLINWLTEMIEKKDEEYEELKKEHEQLKKQKEELRKEKFEKLKQNEALKKLTREEFDKIEDALNQLGESEKFCDAMKELEKFEDRGLITITHELSW